MKAAAALRFLLAEAVPMSTSTQRSLQTSPLIVDAPSQSDRHLLDLNDDCLYHILQFISFDQLVTLLGHLCRRFDEVIKQSFKGRKKYAVSMRFPPSLTADQLEFIGTQVTSFELSVGYSIPKADALKILRPICLGGAQSSNLKSISIHYIYWDESYNECLQHVAAQLTRLDISYTESKTDQKLTRLLANMTSLSTLIVNGVPMLREHFLAEDHLGN